MPKKSKIKCPQCKKSKDVEENHHDCPSCTCGEIYYCKNCGCEFDENGEQL